MRVFVYWNLHKKCWSLRDVKTRKVLEHRPVVRLANCEMKVSEAGRQRVLRERRKNVHAGVVGTVVMEQLAPSSTHSQITYNPYHHKTFVLKKDPQIPVLAASFVEMHDDRSVYAYFIITGE